MLLKERNKYIIRYELYDQKYIHKTSVQPLIGQKDKPGNTEVVVER
jgi:hypothetical protein